MAPVNQRVGRRSRLVLIVVAGLVVGLFGPAWAQESEPLPEPFEPIPRSEAGVSLHIDDGTYVGTVGLAGSRRSALVVVVGPGELPVCEDYLGE